MALPPPQTPTGVLIAVPVFNEIRYVRRVLAKIRSFHPDVLVVDDGSTDGTPEVLRELAAAGEIQLVTHDPNRGYGRSLIDAFAHAGSRGYRWMLTMDCDEQHEPEHIPAFMDAIARDDADIISGSRYKVRHDDDDDAPRDRLNINTTLTRILNDLYGDRGLHLTDSFCGFKAHRVAAMSRLELTEEGYAFPMQFWPQAVAAGLRITELSVRRIYHDPKRHFGGQLDDPAVRLNHYLGVLHAEHARLFTDATPVPALAPAEIEDCCGCGCPDITNA